MKKITYAFVLLAVFGLLLAGCTKKETTESTSNTTTDIQQLQKDENIVENATDDVSNDANTVLSGGNGLKLWQGPCGVTIDSATTIGDTIIYHLTYNGPNCNNTLIRTGNVDVKKKIGEYWVNPGTTVTLTLINFHIVRILHPDHSVTFNGIKHFQNVTGGYLWMIGFELSSVEHKVWGTVQATFSDNSTRTWNIARQQLFTGKQDSLVMAIDGLGTADGYDKLVVWGINRQSKQFYSQIEQTVIYKQACTWDPCAGSQTLLLPTENKSATLTYGYDDNNQPITGDECPTKFKLDWVWDGVSGTIFLPLP